MKASKIASIAYYILIALSAVVLVLFFCVGFGNMESLPSGYYKSPQFTDLLMYWMYALAAIEAALAKGDVEGAKEICRNTRGPVASICYQGLLRIDEGLDVVERSVVSYGGVQSAALEKNCSWVTLFIAMAPSLGFLGTVIGMVMAFDDIQKAGDISPTVVAGGMKVALITTIFGIIVALVLQVFYNFILSKIEALTSDMEDSSITLLDLMIQYNLCEKK